MSTDEGLKLGRRRNYYSEVREERIGGQTGLEGVGT